MIDTKRMRFEHYAANVVLAERIVAVGEGQDSGAMRSQRGGARECPVAFSP